MSHSAKISLPAAIIINLNVMVGSGIFVNTVLLSKQAGGLGALAYLAVAIILLPLIMTMTSLAKMHAGGNFYDYGAMISPYFGFLTTFSYFIAKLSSCTLAIHVCMSMLQTIFPQIATISTVWLDSMLLIIFTGLNTLNLRIGKRIQVAFIICKFVPILFVILTGLYLFNPSNFNPENLYPAGIVSSVPFVLYAFMGFEVSCSLARSIENPEHNAARAMCIAYTIGIATVCLFQLMFYGSLGTIFNSLTSYLEPFPALLAVLQISPQTAATLKAILHVGIASSALGAAYGIMYSNAWNLFELALQGHVVKRNVFMKLNAHNIPVACVIAEAVIVFIYLCATKGAQIPLQQISSFGSTIAYTLCSIALVCVTYTQVKKMTLMPLLGLMSCMVLIGGILRNFMLYGMMPAIIFLMILLGASGMFKRYPHITHDIANES